MGNIWAKIAAGTAVILVIIIGLSYIPADNQPAGQQQPRQEDSENQQKSYYDVIEEDDKRLRAEPEPQQQEKTESQPDRQQCGQDETPEKPEDANQQSTEKEPAEQQQRREFVELNQAEKTQAQRLFENALQQRKMARLPGTSYGHMVDYCRQIIEKFPGSEYAWKARRMLGEVPERLRHRYDITEDEIAGEN